MQFSTLLEVTCLLALYATTAAGSYVLQDDYNPSSFFSMFDFFTSRDPTNGFVRYVDQGTARNTGLIWSNANSIYMGVDHDNYAPNGRPSVRLTSKNSYNHGLVILDLAHMPGGACGSWPAFWTVGPNWPYNGEIDIIEGVHQQTTNSMTLHTGPGCSITPTNLFSGNINTANCDVNAQGQWQNEGCSIGTSEGNTYGAGFNSNGGGVYAMEWTSSAISIYFFPRGSIPSDISNEHPNPSGWRRPLAQFQGGCNLDSMFRNQQIIFDITFCGDWAGSVWGSSSCASQAPTCDLFVQNNPSAFADMYWSINSLKVYQGDSSPVRLYAVKPGSDSDLPSAASSSIAASSTASKRPSSAPKPTTLSPSTKRTKSTKSTKSTTSAKSTTTPLPEYQILLESSDLPATSTDASSTASSTAPFQPDDPASTAPTPAKDKPLRGSWFPSQGRGGGMPAGDADDKVKVKARKEAHLREHQKGRFHGRG